MNLMRQTRSPAKMIFNNHSAHRRRSALFLAPGAIAATRMFMTTGRLATVLACGAVLSAPVATIAKTLPEPQLHVRQVAQDTPISTFLQELAAPLGARVIVSSKITGAISGVFDGPLDVMLSRVGRAFAVAYYYDGQTITFYPAADRTAQTFNLAPMQPQWVRGEALRRGLSDAQDTLQIQGGQLTAAGAPQFLGEIEALARRAPSTSPTSVAPAKASGRQQTAAQDAVEYRVYYLHYGWAADTKINAGDRQVAIPGIAAILRALVAGDSEAGSTQATTKVVAKPSVQKGLAGTGLASTGQNSADVGDARSPATTLGALFGLTGAAGSPAPEEPRRVELQPQAKAQTNQFRVEADPRLNALIVRDTSSNLDLYGPLIAAMDVEPTLVEIEATIIDVDIERAKQSGFNLSYSQPNGGGFSTSLDGVIPSFPQAGGLSISAVIGDKNQFIARLEALESEGAARIVSSPLVMTLSDVEATFQNNQTFYVPVNGSLSTDLYNVTAGTNLRVTPHVTHDRGQDRIRLIVEIDDGSVTSQLVGNIPVVRRASLNTESLILSGQSLLVGGMVTQNDTDYRAKVPGVSAVPLFGQLFRATRKASGHTERLFLITPRLSVVGAPAIPPVGAKEVPPLAQANLGSALPAEAGQ